MRLLYCGCPGFGQLFRSFSLNSDTIRLKRSKYLTQTSSPSQRALILERFLASEFIVTIMMKNRWPWFFLIHFSLCSIVVMYGGCDVKKVVYESMQNVKEQQCLEDPSRNSPDCLERQPYEVYERQRQSTTE